MGMLILGCSSWGVVSLVEVIWSCWFLVSIVVLLLLGLQFSIIVLMLVSGYGWFVIMGMLTLGWLLVDCCQFSGIWSGFVGCCLVNCFAVQKKNLCHSLGFVLLFNGDFSNELRLGALFDFDLWTFWLWWLVKICVRQFFWFKCRVKFAGT